MIEMISGKPPWSNYSTQSKEVLDIIKTEGMVPDIPDVSDPCTDFIVQCLNRDPEMRPDIAALLRHEFILGGGEDTINLSRASPDSVRTSFISTGRAIQEQRPIRQTSETIKQILDEMKSYDAAEEEL